MKKLTCDEQAQLVKLLKKAVAANQLDVGVFVGDRWEACSAETFGVCSFAIAIADYKQFEVGPLVGVYLSESDLKTVRGSLNRNKAQPRKLSSEKAKEMASIRHQG